MGRERVISMVEFLQLYFRPTAECKLGFRRSVLVVTPRIPQRRGFDGQSLWCLASSFGPFRSAWILALPVPDGPVSDCAAVRPGWAFGVEFGKIFARVETEHLDWNDLGAQTKMSHREVI